MSETVYQKIQVVGTFQQVAQRCHFRGRGQGCGGHQGSDLVRGARAARGHFQRQSASVPGDAFRRRKLP